MANIPSSPLPPTRGPKMPRITSPISFFGYSVYRLFLLALLLLTLPTNADANLATCASSYDPNLDYFPDKITVTEAEDFSVTYFKNYKLVTNERTGEVFALYQCGTPAPTGLNATVKVFPIPLETIAITQTSDVPFIETLGMRIKIKYVEGPEYFSSPCIQKMITTGAAESLTPSYIDPVVRETQLEEVQVVFEYSATPSNNKSVSVSTVNDPGVLHRAEWLDYMALFFNAEAKANVAFANISARYDCISKIATTNPNAAKPKVAWVNFKSYQPKKWAISNAAYKLEYIRDAGGVPVYYEAEDFASPAEWQAKMADVDIVLDETYNGNMTQFFTNFNLTALSNFKFLKQGQVWRFDKLQSELGALDWFEGAIINPDAVLEDLLTIFSPAIGLSHTRIWFRDSFRGEKPVIENAGKCPDINSTPAFRASECVVVENTPPPSSSPAVLVRPAALFVIMLASVLAFLLA